MKYFTEVYIESAVAIHGEKKPKEEAITNTASQESIDMCKHNYIASSILLLRQFVSPDYDGTSSH